MTGPASAPQKGAVRPGTLVVGVLAAAAVAVAPHVVSRFELYTITLGALYVIAVVGLNILVGHAGVISLGTAAFAMVGGYSVGIAHAQWGVGYPLGSVFAVIVCTAVGVATALAALRLGAFAIAVVTLAYLNVATAIVTLTTSITGGPEGLRVPRTGFSDAGLWYLIAGAAAVAWVLHFTTVRSPFGRALNASRLSPVLASSLGVRPMGVKIAAFAISAALAGLAGALYPMINGRVNTSNFDVSLSILLVLMVVLGGQATMAGPVVGAAVLTAVPYVLTHVFKENGNRTALVYGIFLLSTVVLFPSGLVGMATTLLHRHPSRSHRSAGRLGAIAEEAERGASDPIEQSAQISALLEPTQGARLEAAGISVSFGKVPVLEGVALRVQPGEVHGLIGPNGSGKTTFLNCLSGFLRAQGGKVMLDGESLAGTAAGRARAGIARTFQQPILEASASAFANLQTGVDANRKSRALAYVLRVPSARREARLSVATTDQWLRAVGLDDVAGYEAGHLPPGKQRLLEVGRAMATRPKILLLDEPAAGLTGQEIRQLEAVIRAAQAAGMSILLIDHHVDFVLRLCDRITVFAAGSVIASGSPDEIRSDAAVIDAYLGGRRAASNGGLPPQPARGEIDG